MSLTKKILNTINNNELLKDAKGVLICVSGGPDSVALLHIMHEICNSKKIKLHVAHVNYGLRGSDSEKDQALVESLTENLQVVFHLYQPNIKEKSPSEENLRKLRYDFFKSIAKKENLDLIVLGHTKNDQAETVLHRIIRGSGLSGLSAMKLKNDTLIRPLLLTSKDEIISYLKDRDISYRIDTSNLQNTYTRNKIRNSLIPFIENEFNPKIIDTLSSLAQTTTQDYDYLKICAKKLKFVEFSDSSASFLIKDFIKLHSAMQFMLLRTIMEKLKKELSEIELNHLLEIVKIIRSTKNKRQFHSIKGLKIERKGGIVILRT